MPGKQFETAKVRVTAELTDLQSEQLQGKVSALPFKLGYQEQQRGPNLLVIIDCTRSQEKTVLEMIFEVGATPQQG